MERMKVSIVVPIYNVETYIIDCLKSIEVQTCSDYEVILIDDCGTDRSMILVDEFLESSLLKNKTSILHHDHNRGLSAARNTGTEVARGQYVYYLDSDDTITSDCIEKLVMRMQEANADVVIGNINIIGSTHSVPTLNDEICNSTIKGRDDILNSYLTGKWYMMAWNKLIKRDFLNRNNISFVEGLVHEDNPWSFEVACCASKIAFVSDKTYNYLIRQNSLQTGRDFTKHYNAYMEIMRIIENIITDKHVEKQAMSWFERQKALYFSMTQENGSTQECKEMYCLIHKLLPNFSYSKADLHYMFPKCIAYYLYKKFYGYHLC